MVLVEVSADLATVALHTPATTYAIRLDRAAGTVRPIHWGPRLTATAAATVPAWSAPRIDSWEGMTDGAEEYPVDGGLQFSVPALAAGFADGSAGVELTFVEQRSTADEFVVVLADSYQPLTVELHYRVRADTDVIERWAVLRHTGDEGTIVLHRHDAAAWCLPMRDDYRISHMTGAWSAEGRVHREVLPVAETVLASRRGVTGHHANPWVMIDDGGAGEEHGEVWSAALAFSGSWRITAARTGTGRCSIVGGAGRDGVLARLEPGAELTTPVFAGLYSAGGFGAASRAWHDYQVRHLLPHPEELRPVLYNSWEATTFDVTEDGQLALAKSAAALGVELFVVDDGWFGARTSDRAGLGDWAPNPARFPNGLRPLADEVRRLGMSFGLWVEPEMTNPDSDLYRAHPDWVHHAPHHRRTELRNQLVLDFGRPEVQDWAVDWLDALVRDTGLDFLKWDYNRPFTEAREAAWTEHALGTYAVLDRLRAARPGLRIESCASGGGRADLGILARTDQVWVSDNTDAVDRLVVQEGYSQVYAPATMVAWVTDSPNPLTKRAVPLRFRFHVAMSGVLGLGGDLAAWRPEELEEAAALIAVYRDIRPVVQRGALFRLRPAASGTPAVQYVHEDRVVVFAWRVAADFAPALGRLRLLGIDPAADYRDDESGEVHAGAVLTGPGLALRLPEGAYASRLIRLRRV